MNVLITGHTGFIGSCLWKTIENKNYITKIFGISTNKWFETLDLIGSQKFDIIYHLAASMSEDLFINPQLTMNILDMYKKWESKSFIHTSSISIDLKVPSFYSLSKKISEDLCSFYVNKYNINACSIRIPSVYGPEMKSKTIIDKFIRASLKDEDIVLYGRGERKQWFGYVKDVATILELAGKQSLRGVFLYPCHHITMKKLAEIIIEILSSKSKIKYVDKNDIIYNKSNYELLPFKEQYGLEGGIKDYARWIEKENNKC